MRRKVGVGEKSEESMKKSGRTQKVASCYNMPGELFLTPAN